MAQPTEYRGRPLPPEIIRQVRRMRRSGLTFRAIARSAGVCVETVWKYVVIYPVGYPHHPELQSRTDAPQDPRQRINACPRT